MNKIRLFILLTGFFSLLLVSCEEFLDRPPLDEITQDNYWKTSKDLQKYVVKYYTNFSGYGTNANSTPYRWEAYSDNMTKGVSANNLLDGNISTKTGSWTGDWSDIRSINIFFDNYKKCEFPFDDYKQYLGEAYFFKAWFYFDLVQRYGDIPWYSSAIAEEDMESLLKPRDPRTMVVDSILMHLDKAIEYLDTRKNSDYGNTSLTKEAALAFKTRVALYEGSWQKYHSGTVFATPDADPAKYFQICVDAAEELMTGNYTVGIYKTGNPDTDFHDLFIKSNMTPINEVLLYRAYSIADASSHNVNHYATIIPEDFCITWELVTSYLSKSGIPYDYMGLASTTKGNAFLTKISQDCDPRLQAVVWIPGQKVFDNPTSYFTKPLLTKSPSGFQPRMYARTDISADDPDDSGFIILRYAEVLLNYAEAKYELDGTVAYTQLNLLRARAGMPDFTVNPQSSDLNPVDYGYTISDELYEIRRERRVETAIQRIRESDWKRWASHALFKDKRFRGYPFKLSEFPTYKAKLDENGLLDFMRSELPDGHQFRPGQDYLESIPVDELTLNPNLTQNPGWQ